MLAQLMYRLGLFKLFERVNHSLYEDLYYTSEIKKISSDFDRILKTEGNLHYFTSAELRI